MLFNSITFVLYFLPAVMAGFCWCLRSQNSRAPQIFLIVASLIFYGAWQPAGVFLLLFSIAFNYSIGSLLVRADMSHRWRLTAVIIGIVGDVALLGYFKYATFIVANIAALTGMQFATGSIILPLAISFFTFTQIAFLVDAYRGDVREMDIVRYLLFVTFFPHVIAGPIYHHKEMTPQFARLGSWRIDWVDVAVGIVLFGLGLLKKVMLADSIAPYANSVFGGASGGWPLTLFEAWGGLLAFFFQIYFDFSGYTDMALGLALMFGVRMPVNFNSPYKATSIIEFWQRWHMTLTRFLTDYIYSPIALNLTRRGIQAGAGRIAIFVWSVAIPVNLTFLVSGIWHGAGWTFVMFGAINGLALTVNYGWRQFRLPGVPAAVGWTLTMLTFAGSLIFFRADSLNAATQLIKGLVGHHGVMLPAAYADALGSLANVLRGLHWRFDDVVLTYLKLPEQLVWLVGMFAIVLLFPNTQQILQRFRPTLEEGRNTAASSTFATIPAERIVNWLLVRSAGYPISRSALCGAAAAIAICMLIVGQSWMRTQVAQFIYFQF